MPHTKKLEQIQILRAVAALSVVIYHQKLAFHFGRFGVDIFFVLSGYLMCLVTTNYKRSPIYFIKTRIARIIPLYWMMTIVTVIACFFYPQLFTYTEISFQKIFFSLFFIPYYKTGNIINPVLSVGWTLSYEMLFYTLLTFSIWIKKNELIVVVFSFIIFTAIRVNSIESENPYLDFVGNPIIWEFFLGIIAYRFRNSIKHHCSKLVLLMVVFLSYSYMGYKNWINFGAEDVIFSGFNRLFFFGVPSFLFVISFTSFEFNAWNKKFKYFIIYIGDSSYSIYLTHLFVVASVSFLYRKQNFLEHQFLTEFAFLFLGIVLSLVVGGLTYYFIEKSINAWAKKTINRDHRI